MSDSVGSVSVDVVPDARGWAEKLRAQIRDVTVKVKADTTDAREQIQSAARNTTAKIKVSLDGDIKAKLAALQADLRKKTLELGVSTSAAQTKIAALQTELATLKAGNADLDDTAAKAKIAEIQAQIKSLKGQLDLDTAPAREAIAGLKAEMASTRLTAEIKAQADTGEAEAELDATARTRTAKIKTELSKGATVLDGFIGKLGLLPALAVVAGSALIPVAAALGGIAAALAAPLVIAGGGATLFAFMGGLAVKDAQAQLKVIDTIEKHLATLTKGTSAYTATQKQLKDAQDALPKSVGAFSSALEGLKSTFAHVSMDVLLKPITAGLKLLTDILPMLNPLLAAASGAFTTMIDELDKGAKSQGFAQFIHTVAHQMGPDLLAFAHIAGNVGVGLGGLITALGGSRISGGLLSGLERLSHSFADWGNSKGARHEMRQFFGYVHDVGPQVAHTIGAIASALGKVVEALAPLGPVVLQGIQGVASGLAAIPIPVLTALAAAFAGLVGFQKVGGFKVASFLTKGLGSGRGSTPANPLFVLDVNGGGGALKGEGKLFGRFALAELLSGAAQFGLLAAAAYFDYRATKTVIHQVATSESKFMFGQALPTMGGPDSHIDPKTRAAVIRQQQQLFAMDGGGNSSLNSTTTHFDALKAHAQQASRQIDMIGPHAVTTFNQADQAVDAFRTKLAAIHDKQVRVILQDQPAIQSLEALQRMRINDKYFNIYARNLGIERTVGPGGGMGHPALTSSGSGGGGAGVTYTGPITINAQDHADMQRQMQRRQRQAAISGVQVGP